jgi:hypothetical protein
MTDEFDTIEERLESARPVPHPAFRSKLRRELLTRANAQPSRPNRLGSLIAAYAGSGLVLLVFAGAGIAGIGPLAA